MPLTDLCYADGTLLVGRAAHATQVTLHALQEEAERYNLRLSKGKCALLKGEGEGRVRFTDGRLVPLKGHVNYLGAILEN